MMIAGSGGRDPSKEHLRPAKCTIHLIPAYRLAPSGTPREILGRAVQGPEPIYQAVNAAAEALDSPGPPGCQVGPPVPGADPAVAHRLGRVQPVPGLRDLEIPRVLCSTHAIESLAAHRAGVAPGRLDHPVT